MTVPYFLSSASLPEVKIGREGATVDAKRSNGVGHINCRMERDGAD